MTTTATISYRKTKQGTWVAFGPVDQITAGSDVTVTKRSGETKTEWIESVGRTFRVDGRDMVYGYIGRRPAGSCCATPEEHLAHQQRIARELSGSTSQTRLTGRCTRCRCHREQDAGQPGSIMFDGCDYCGCEAI